MDKYEVGDVVRLKKQHPCGSSEWEILRVGADFRLKCLGCGHQIMIARKLVEKNTREIRKRKLSKKFLQTIDFYDKIYLRDILLNSLLTHMRAGQRPKGGKFA